MASSDLVVRSYVPLNAHYIHTHHIRTYTLITYIHTHSSHTYIHTHHIHTYTLITYIHTHSSHTYIHTHHIHTYTLITYIHTHSSHTYIHTHHIHTYTLITYIHTHSSQLKAHRYTADRRFDSRLGRIRLAPYFPFLISRLPFLLLVYRTHGLASQTIYLHVCVDMGKRLWAWPHGDVI